MYIGTYIPSPTTELKFSGVWNGPYTRHQLDFYIIAICRVERTTPLHVIILFFFIVFVFHRIINIITHVNDPNSSMNEHQRPRKNRLPLTFCGPFISVGPPQPSLMHHRFGRARKKKNCDTVILFGNVPLLKWTLLINYTLFFLLNDLEFYISMYTAIYVMAD